MNSEQNLIENNLADWIARRIHTLGIDDALSFEKSSLSPKHIKVNFYQHTWVDNVCPYHFLDYLRALRGDCHNALLYNLYEMLYKYHTKGNVPLDLAYTLILAEEIAEGQRSIQASDKECR